MFYRWFKGESEKNNFDKGSISEPKMLVKMKQFFKHYGDTDSRCIVSKEDSKSIYLQTYDEVTTSWWGRLRISKLKAEQKNKILKYLQEDKIPLFKRETFDYGELKSYKYKIQEEDKQNEPQRA